jgi:hypothetical protein
MRCAAPCLYAVLFIIPSSVTAQDSTFRSQAELAREGDSIRAAYFRSQAELARKADSIRAAYQDSLAEVSGVPNNESPVGVADPLPTLGLQAASAPRFIRGFARILWGSSLGDIIAKKGKPLQQSKKPTGIVLGYTENLLGNDAITVFLLSKTEGLLKGTLLRAKSCDASPSS